MSTAIATGRMIVIDDEPAVAKAIASAGKSIGLEVEVFDSCESYLAKTQAPGPCCVVLDLKLPGMSGLELLKKLGRDGYMPSVIMISGHGTIESAVAAMRHGAVTFVEKPFSYHALLQHVTDSLAVAAKNWEQFAERKRAIALLEALKPRERELLHLLVKGHSNKQMAPLLSMSVRGVEDRRSRIMQKLEVESVAELCRIVHVAGERVK